MNYRIGRMGFEPMDPILRHNDGSMVIMRGDPEGEDYRPALLVPRIAPAKRGEAWKTPDPEQEAFAQRVVDMLNTAEGRLDHV